MPPAEEIRGGASTAIKTIVSTKIDPFPSARTPGSRRSSAPARPAPMPSSTSPRTPEFSPRGGGDRGPSGYPTARRRAPGTNAPTRCSRTSNRHRFPCADFPIVKTRSPKSAEMIKYAANAFFLAVKITLINEIAALCERVRRRREGSLQGHSATTSASGNQIPPRRAGLRRPSCFPKGTPHALARIGQRTRDGRCASPDASMAVGTTSNQAAE